MESLITSYSCKNLTKKCSIFIFISLFVGSHVEKLKTAFFLFRFVKYIQATYTIFMKFETIHAVYLTIYKGFRKFYFHYKELNYQCTVLNFPSIIPNSIKCLF